MTCPSCSQPVPEGARFCPNCGAVQPVAEGPREPVASHEAPPEPDARATEARAPEPPPPTPPPLPPRDQAPEPPPPTPLTSEEPPPPPPRADAPEPMPRAVTGEASLGAGILRATVLGALVFVVMLLLSAVVAFAAFFTRDADALEIAKLSGVIFFVFHHVGIRTEFPTFDASALPGGEGAQSLPLGPIDLSFTVYVALLLGTLLALVLLYRGGRRAAEEGGGSTGARILQGAFVGVPYAVLAGLLSFVVRFEFELGAQLAPFFGPSGAVEMTAPLLAALLWPLGIGIVGGALGGYAAARRDRATPGPGRLGAMVSGAWRMLVALLVAGFVGLLILGAVNPDLTASYFELVGSGRSGLVLLLATIAAVPNMALWGITMGMGGSIVAGDLLGTDAQHVASLLEFPSDLDLSVAGPLTGAGAPELSTAVAPIEYFAFILLTLIALIIGGRMAAQRARVLSAGRGALIGAGSGVIFAVAFFGALALAGITVSASATEGQAELARMGPALWLGGLLGLGWGVVAGAIGGTTGTGAEAPFPVERRPAPPPVAPPPVPATTAELPPQPAPTAEATGFEGLAAERAALRPEPEPEPEPESQPRPEDAEASLATEEAGKPEPPQAPMEPRVGEPPAFELPTPQAQWRAPEPEPPAEGEGSEEPEPAPWSDPAAFEPLPWEPDTGEGSARVSEPWAQEPPEEEEEEEGPAPA